MKGHENIDSKKILKMSEQYDHHEIFNQRLL